MIQHLEKFPKSVLIYLRVASEFAFSFRSDKNRFICHIYIIKTKYHPSWGQSRSTAARDGKQRWDEGGKKLREFCSHEPPSFEPSIHYQPAEARSEGWRQNTRPADGSTRAKMKFQTNFYSKFWILSKSRNNSWFARLLFFKNNELIYYYRKTFKKQVLFFVPSEAWHCYNSWFCFFRVNNNLQLPNLVKTLKNIYSYPIAY